MENKKIIGKLQAAHDEYFALLIKHFPGNTKDTQFGDFGPVQLYDLAIEVHACAAALGPHACERLRYMGLDLLYPFDNPVDLYAWRMQVKEKKIPHTTYAAIAIRIDSEIKRLDRILELGGNSAYEALPIEAFLVPRTHYELFDVPVKATGKPPHSATEPAQPAAPIPCANLPPNSDHQAVNALERFEIGTTIGANIAAIASLFGRT